MIRIILAVIVGFVAWSIMWVGSERVLSIASPHWFGANQIAFEKATLNKEAYTPDTTILVLNVVRGTIVTIITGFLAALIARENRRSTLILGILLVAFGLVVVVMTWHIIPLWYHVVFTLMLIPMTIVGGRLKSFS
jgi:hypothetical protein